MLLGLAFVLGFALMGFEMLGSRYLYPYFGGGINTWAVLIATVLLALIFGYFIGGYLVDRDPRPMICGWLLVGASLYLFSIPFWAAPAFAWILENIGDGMFGIMLAANALLLVPLTLISVFSPFGVRLLLNSIEYGGRLVAAVYGISTFGNVLGVLVTTFTLMPVAGSRTLTMVFAGIIGVCGLVMATMDSIVGGHAVSPAAAARGGSARKRKTLRKTKR